MGPDVSFSPRVAVASLSGQSDATWATNALPHVGAAFLGGIALDEPTREGARELVERDREEFLPDDPIGWIDEQLATLADEPLLPAVNVRAASPEPIADAARRCAAHDAILEVNAHCRQPELCAVGTGQTLLREPERLANYVDAATTEGATVSVKLRTELADVDLPVLASRLEVAGADVLHVDAMDSEPEIADVVEATDAFVIANNEVRGRESVREYLEYGADAVSVGRPSTEPAVLERVRSATEAWFEAEQVAP
ncbi:dihydropyrimidine dehydrogenase [Salinarchaeum sp. Harcht-Bsk1]|uniref:tRNA-dihydrouridine synthase n=1 Tax=Salinarchaeum sp. Harcht-Bsk1 TaxID=1333523 RepID=UPI0003422A72|nr:tRNA-dihydrouridine synthase [Salinarchaeum sp. Harcht-Bsk1]AGM99992.1 dihydropyrimidine dehydrogenase [Salinarchaeum sp. Harcht-Bsk1]